MSSLRTRLLRSAFAVLLVTSAGVLPAACSRPHGEASSGAARDLTDEQAKVLLAALAQAPSHGFQPGAFGELGLADPVKAGKAAAMVRLRQAALAYAKALHGHAIPAASFDPSWGVRPEPYDAEAEFTAAARAGRLEDWVKGLAPASPQYQGLRAAYAAYGKVRAAGGWAALADSSDLKPGARGPAVAALRTRLAVEDAAAAQAGANDTFDAAMTQAVQRAQARYGQHPTGVVDADLRAALNVPVETRLAQIRANLERFRWLPRDLDANRIEVNTAGGFVDVYQGGKDVLHMLAAAGKPGDESPILVSRIQTVVLNPPWNVPTEIAENEIRPKGAAYLQRMGFTETSTGDGTRLVQQPGPKNALGQVKFLFPNDYSVYLHDTPARSAFAREQRSVSHGCVRLARALDLAQLLLSTQAGWTPERMQAALASGDTTAVTLDRPVQVMLTYMTAFAQRDGHVGFRPDVYGWDADVLRRLDATRPSSA
jgi:murein L,D-transpeptidase YcbB/YkuD